MSTPNATTRAERLRRRAEEAQDLVVRLAADLTEAEGQSLATASAVQLSFLVARLRSDGRAGQ